jgi:hypothetical protein
MTPVIAGVIIFHQSFPGVYASNVYGVLPLNSFSNIENYNPVISLESQPAPIGANLPPHFPVSAQIQP